MGLLKLRDFSFFTRFKKQLFSGSQVLWAFFVSIVGSMFKTHDAESSDPCLSFEGFFFRTIALIDPLVSILYIELPWSRICCDLLIAYLQLCICLLNFIIQRITNRSFSMNTEPRSVPACILWPSKTSFRFQTKNKFAEVFICSVALRAVVTQLNLTVEQKCLEINRAI